MTLIISNGFTFFFTLPERAPPPGGIDIAPPIPTPLEKWSPNISVLSSFLCVFLSDSGAWWDIQLPWPIANANGLTSHFATLCLHDIEDTLLVFTTSYFHNHTHEKYSVLKGKKHDIGYQLSNGQGGLIITIKNPIEMLLCSAERRDGYD